ncbi:CoA pyrophosphatase [Orbus sturtevantii]|uniref:NUDIX hydrolase n=1 Tax=Orbus sturtevantii TaxID=3074109 RepID=UPI00370D61B1
MITTSDIFRKIENRTKESNLKDKAAVLIPIIQVDNQLQLLFEVRSSKLKWQPSDICFPGGRMELIDNSPTDTAIRETSEELGIAQNTIKIYGSLSPFLANIGLKIYPVVGELTSLQLNINPDEVANTFSVPIEWFIEHPPIETTMEVAYKPGNNFPFHLIPNYTKTWQKLAQHNIYVYHYKNYVIWGLTAQIIRLFLQEIN